MLNHGPHRPYHWSSLSSTSPMLESRPVGHGFKRIRSLGIYVQSTDFNVSNFFFFSKNHGNEISTVMCWNQPWVSVGFYFLPRVGSAVGTERNLSHVGWFKKGLIQMYTGMTQKDVMSREVGGGFMFENACTPVVDSCQCMAKPIQYCKVK